MDKITKEYVDYLAKNGIFGTVDTNPSPERIKYIKNEIKKREQLMKKTLDNL